MSQNGDGLTEDDFAVRRARMVDEQIAGRDVRDERVLQVMKSVPRHLFVPPEERRHAYGDYPLPIGNDQTISQPYVVASMTEHLKLPPAGRVLEIGTGCGYQTAVLAEMTSDVFTIEVIGILQERARQTLASLGYKNIQFRVGDGGLGWPEAAPFDGIIVTAAAPRIPPALIEQLADGGRMVIPVLVPNSDLQELVRLTKSSAGLIRESLYQVRFVPMRGSIEGS